MIDVRTGLFRFVSARAVLLATGGGPTMYRYHTPSGDKSMDGLAMALRLGLPLRDMEMVQFHPTGLLAGPDTRMTGTVLEEGLRGSGGHLLNGQGERFMTARDPRAERATRDFVSRCIYEEMRAGRTTPQRRRAHQDEPSRARASAQGVQGHGGALRRLRLRPGRRPRRGGADGALLHGRAWCAASTRPPSCRACSWRARMPAARTAPTGSAATASPIQRYSAASPGRAWRPGWRQGAGQRAPDEDVLAAEMARAQMPFARKAGDLNGLRERLLDAMWDDVGVMRDATGLKRGLGKLDAIEAELLSSGVADGDRAFNLTWHDWLNLRSLIEISKVITLAALRRENSRGAHYREDFPDEGDLATSTFTVARQRPGCSTSPTSRSSSPTCGRAKPCSTTRRRRSDSLPITSAPVGVSGRLMVRRKGASSTAIRTSVVSLVPIERVERAILLLRGHRVMLDADLANLYGVETGALTRAVRRNANRFPADFMFQLTKQEFEDLRRQSGISSAWGGRRYAPYAFTEQGVAMLSSVLRSERAVLVNIEIMRAFVQLRQMLASSRGSRAQTG